MQGSRIEPRWLDYFSGGVPTGEFFRMTLDDLSEIVSTSRGQEGINRLTEVCIIGLASYFEAFCKDHFASILNVEPRLLENLKRQGQDVTIDSAQLLLFDHEWSCKLGFLIAEKYDFGTAQKINALYFSLLNISPFSKSEANFHEQFLRDRNLLVHHGGVYTFSHLQQQKTTDSDVRNRAFSHSLVVTKEYFMDRLSFIREITQKLLKASHSSLTNYLQENEIECTAERRKAIDSFLWWGEEKI